MLFPLTLPRRPALAIAMLMAFMCGAARATDIEVLALFRDQAVLKVDGARYRLGPGEATPEGVRLVSTYDAGAVLEVEGQQRRIALGSKVRSSYQQSAREEVQIFRDSTGMFSTVGSINGMPVSFLVDTGATTLAMNSAQARRLGIDFRVEGETGSVVTASGVEQAYAVMLDSVKVGAIQLRNVQAVVLDGPQPQQILLGMSFLGRVDMQNDGQRLLLRRKY